MGVTIHYRGKLKSPSLIEPLMHEVADICESKKWKYNLLNGHLDVDEDMMSAVTESHDEETLEEKLMRISLLENVGLQGISFHPHPKAESVILTFNTEGELRSLMAMLLLPECPDTHGLLFTKTQFAGIDTHVEIIHLLIYLRKKYFKKLKIIDEGGYYPRKNLHKLTQRLGVIDFAISTIQDILDNTEFKGSPEEMIEHVQEALSRSIKGAQVKIIRMEDFNVDPEDKENEKGWSDEDDIF